MHKILTTTIGTGLNILSYLAPGKTGEIGFNLFCYPVRPSLRPRHREFLNKARHTVCQVGGEQIQSYRWGHGPVKILLAHGWQSHSYRWKPYIEALAGDVFTVYSVDAPGHGLSSGRAMTVPMYAEAVRRIWDEAGEFQAMVGHSLGGFMLLNLLHENPDRNLDRLVLLAPPENVGQFFTYYQDQLNLSDRTMDLTINQFRNHLKRPPEYYSAADFAKSVRAKGLLIHDETDQETPLDNSLAIRSAWKEADLVVTKGYGHNLRAQEVIDRVVSFLAAGQTSPPFNDQ